jgi:hypothetical protein
MVTARSVPDDSSAATARELSTAGPAPAATAALIAVVGGQFGQRRHVFQAGLDAQHVFEEASGARAGLPADQGGLRKFAGGHATAASCPLVGRGDHHGQLTAWITVAARTTRGAAVGRLFRAAPAPAPQPAH